MSIEQNIERIAVALEKLAGNALLPAASAPAEASVEEPPKKKKAGAKKGKDAALAVTFEDMQRAATELINSLPENKAGFNKAKAVLAKLSTTGKMADVTPDNYQAAIDAFKKDMPVEL